MSRITVDDARKAGLCVSGLIEFAARHNLDFRDFVRNGIEESTLIELGESATVERIRAIRNEDV